ncbi:UNVERIFIED_CONTAM: putative WRKY transcription factor 40 [Sesamum radiatum]|uniref:WRKY transcription factor 40 n=1 Tax=Sesamum radiatum TaxID=300843 RepID=A0AAW2TSB2_SESRA
MDRNLSDYGSSILTIDLNTNPNPMHVNPTHQSPAGDEMTEELSRMKWENKKLSDMLTILTRNYNDLMQTRKRKAVDSPSPGSSVFGNDNDNDYSCCDETSAGCLPRVIKSNVSRVYVRIDPSDTSLVVKDGYGWRKYGQKVTRDNPSPRAYYKCSFAPACPVKKKVRAKKSQRPSLLVATYEGQHHHCRPSQANISAVSPAGGATGASISGQGTGSTESFNFLDPLICSKIQKATAATESSEMQQFLVEKMASSLTRNPAFTAALAAAITGRILDEVMSEENKDVVSNSRGFSV